MIAGYGGFPDETERDIRICLENINRLRVEYDSADGRLTAHISELVRAMLSLAGRRENASAAAYDKARGEKRAGAHTPSADTLRELYREICPFAGAVSKEKTQAKDTPYPTDSAISPYGTDELLLRAMTCMHLCRALKGATNELSADSLLGSLISPARGISVAYLQNAYSDEAFDVFSHYLCDAEGDTPQKLLCDDMHTVCDEVAAGNASYCILPLENLSEGRLGGARRLLHEYDLKIAHTVALKPKGIVFALLRKTLCRLSAAKSGPLFYEFSLHGGNTVLGEILHTAEIFGLSVHKTDTVPLSYSDSEYRFDIILCCPEKLADIEDRLISFILYLILEAPDHSPVGHYRATEWNRRENE